MIFDRCIYRIPASEHETYWEDTWATTDWEKLVASQPKKDWWSQLEALPAQLAPGELILEAGCGAAPVVYLLHERGYTIRGVDLAKDTIARVHALHPELDLRVSDVAKLDEPDASVGLYVSLGVVEHDPDGPDKILAEAARVTKPGGLAFFTIPYLNIYRRMREPWWRLKHVLRRAFRRPPLRFYQYAFSKRALRRYLARAGFEILELRYCHTAVALRKDFGVDGKRARRIAARIDRRSPRLAAHVVAITARRVPTST